MKYWNKNSDVRKKHWHKVSLNSKYEEKYLKNIFQLHPSTGKFHIADLSTIEETETHFLYSRRLEAAFELEQDAILMSLRYGG